MEMIMNVEYVENLEDGLLAVTVTLQKRKKARENRLRIRTEDVLLLLKENYNVPPTHILGECSNPLQMADNEHEEQCSITWRFPLLKRSPDKSKTTPTAAKSKSRATRKKSKA